MNKTFIANNETKNRLDLAISLQFSDISRSKAAKLIKAEKVLVNGKIAKPSYVLKVNDVIEINDDYEEENINLTPENIPLDIVYEDDDLLVINKPRGMVVHPGNGNHDHTLVNALLFYSKNLSTLGGEFRPGIVHRIDKDTSGLLVVAKNDNVHKALSEQLATHSMHREYYALVKGVIGEDDGKIIAPIGRDRSDPLKQAVDVNRGKDAETLFHVIERFLKATLIEVTLKTGRTHQIRVHLDYIKHPLIGDLVYGKDNRNIIKDGQILHAYKLTFFHPTLKKEMSFTAPIPNYFKEAVDIYKSL